MGTKVSLNGKTGESKKDEKNWMYSRRGVLKALGIAAGGMALTGRAIKTLASDPVPPTPGGTAAQTAREAAGGNAAQVGAPASTLWNSDGPYISEPQKAPLILLTDRPVQLETPRHYFATAFTPNEAFYVRWHLDNIPNEVNLAEWRLRVEGNVAKPVTLSLRDLMEKFEPVSVAAVNQCSGNSRSRMQPRVPGGQWGNGAMGNALWTGVPLREILDHAGVKSGSLQAQFQGLETGEGPKALGSGQFLKSLDLANPVLDECVVAYLMNGSPLPMLNGFPVRLVVPGYFATYWMKCLTWIRVLDKPDENFWMKSGYKVPDTARGNTTPEAVKAGEVKMVPISRMPVRSFPISPDGATKIPAGMTVPVRGIAFSGHGRIVKVEVSSDGGRSWSDAKLGEDHGAYSFRTWESLWTPRSLGKHTLMSRATDEKGNTQPDEPVWNPGGYLWNRIERVEPVAVNAE